MLKIALVSQITAVTKENGLFILEKGLLFYRKGYDRSEKRHGAREKRHVVTRKGRSAILKGPWGNTTRLFFKLRFFVVDSSEIRT